MSRERGFSLVELLVAIVMTLIVSGAIYGLMASGQGSFKREPALIDRQQNIRVAMDVIVRDLENAGGGMSGYISRNDPVPPPLSQVFATGLDNLGPAASAILGGGLTDALEFFAPDGSCPTLHACPALSDAANIFFYDSALPANGCMGTPAAPLSFFGYVSGVNATGTRSTAVVSNLTPGILRLTSAANANLLCAGGNAVRAHLAIPAGQAPSDPCAAGACASVTKVARVRYEIAGENPALPASFGPGLVAPWTANPALNPPCLWRSEYGRTNVDGTPNAGPYILPAGANNPWQMVARGIDDMQIDYQTAIEFLGAAPDTTWLVMPPAIANPAPDTDAVVRRVRIRLSARAIGTQLGGETTYATNAAGEPGRRGQLTTIVTLRSALKTLAMDTRANRNWR